MSSVLKGTIANKTAFVTTHFTKLTTGNHVLIASVIVQSNCQILVFTSNVQCVRLAAGRRTLKMCCHEYKVLEAPILRDIVLSDFRNSFYDNNILLHLLTRLHIV